MRIHTSATREQIERALSGLPGVRAETLTEHRSATHPRAFELHLSGSGRHGGQSFGTQDYKSATWDEWGVVMARIFGADPLTRMGGTAERPVYADADEYHWKTGDRFRDETMPNDTHPQHRWEITGTVSTGSYSLRECRKCSAVQRWHW